MTSDEDGYLIGVEGKDETRVFAKNVVLATGADPDSSRAFPLTKNVFSPTKAH